ncbi:opioid-binding protein/cell adhesion molecule-like isoform X2 [Macrobrachium rosenbergii]|uniref:opioid-binding protein/cell adhesion molecule-like isoform X2 n=1 Tax=Macrobrachium rosenbergii TaxID=79674 RepID=UPI0034D68E19
MHLSAVLVLLIANIGLADPDPGMGLADPDPGSKPKKKTGNWKKPEFDETLPDNITVMEGDTASLPCVVSRLRGRSVSWIRQSDLHVISANELTFTSDDRFRVIIDNLTSSFALEVISALRNDSGVYECQVNTRPKLSRPITLNVQVPAAKIQGPSELYIKSGSTLVISCTALLHPDAVSTVDWLHNQTKLSIAGPRGGVSIHTEKAGQLVSSKLSVGKAVSRDAGNYTCQPDSVHPASISVFIVEDEFPAAMHHESSCHSLDVSRGLLVALLLINAALLTAR